MRKMLNLIAVAIVLGGGPCLDTGGAQEAEQVGSYTGAVKDGVVAGIYEGSD